MNPNSSPIKRLVSLDAFRGFTIAAMILVNNPGLGDNVFAPLLHARWWGITPTDMIPSSFLFIVGVAIAFAYTRRKEAGEPPRSMYSKMVVRAVKIFAVGMVLNVWGLMPDFDFDRLRWTGTLHRIAFVFLGCGLLFLHASWRTQAVVGGAILLGYYAVMTLIPTPGVGKVMLEPGVNMAHWIDSHLLVGHKWQGTWDPEGILANISSVATGISGMVAGAYLLGRDSWERKVINLFFAGGLSILSGILWGWGSALGVSANLWSPAYVLISSGFAAAMLAGCIYVIDILGRNRNAAVDFGVIYGMNAIAVYVLADLFNPLFYSLPIGGSTLNEAVCGFAIHTLGMAPKAASMAYAVGYVMVCFVPAWLLYRKRIFIKL